MFSAVRKTVAVPRAIGLFVVSLGLWFSMFWGIRFVARYVVEVTVTAAHFAIAMELFPWGLLPMTVITLVFLFPLFTYFDMPLGDVGKSFGRGFSLGLQWLPGIVVGCGITFWIASIIVSVVMIPVGLLVGPWKMINAYQSLSGFNISPAAREELYAGAGLGVAFAGVALTSLVSLLFKQLAVAAVAVIYNKARKA